MATVSNSLFIACSSGRLDIVKYLIDEQQVDPSCRDKHGRTVLHFAAGCGHLAVVKYLITEKRCDPMCKEQCGRTPLHDASENGHLDVIKYLIDEHQVDPSCRGEGSETPLLLAALRGHLAVVKYLITEKFCDPMCKGPRGVTPLVAASGTGHLDVIKYLIDEQQVDPSCRDDDGTTLLHIAATAGQLAVVKYLISEKLCDPDCKDDTGITPCDYAIAGDHLALVKFFLEVSGTPTNTPKTISPDVASSDSGNQSTTTSFNPQVLQAAIALSNTVRAQTSRPIPPSQQQDVAASDSGGLSNPEVLRAAIALSNYVRAQKISPQPSSPVPMGPEFDERPTAQELLSLIWKNGDRTEEIRIMDEVKSRWRDFGIALGFSFGDLDAIEMGGLGNPGRCIQSVYGEWSQRSSTCHWKGLIAALHKAGFPDLATRVTYAVENPRMPSTLEELWSHRQLKPFVLQNPRPTGTALGNGAYGSVEEVEIEGTIYAGKKFRRDLFTVVEEEKFCEMFMKEYVCVHQLRHNHIVQYHGICTLPDSKLPVLVMERLETSLHNYLLSPDNANLDLAVKVSILRGIAKGLVYLHNQTPAIIHRDLTAKNVLLDSKLVPKISDFGNSQFFDADPSSSLKAMSNVPGTPPYMPPEACDEDARYNTKLDVFSYGHLALFTATQVFPSSLLPITYCSDIGVLLARAEVDRRKKYFDMLGDRHPLTNLIKQCLDNKPEVRPKATAIETKLDEL